MPHIYFLIEFSLLYIIRDICVYSSMIRFISSYLHTHTHSAHSPSPALPVNRFIASRIKQSAHRLNCSFGIFPLLFCWRSSVQIVARQHFSIEHFVHTLQNALVVHYNRLSVAHKHRAYALWRSADASLSVPTRLPLPGINVDDDDWSWIGFDAPHTTKLPIHILFRQRSRKLHGEFIQ